MLDATHSSRLLVGPWSTVQATRVVRVGLPVGRAVVLGGVSQDSGRVISGYWDGPVNVRHGEQRSKSFRALAIKAFAEVIAPV